MRKLREVFFGKSSNPVMLLSGLLLAMSLGWVLYDAYLSDAVLTRPLEPGYSTPGQAVNNPWQPAQPAKIDGWIGLREKGGYSSGGYLPLTPTDESVIEVDSAGLVQPLDVAFYEATMDDLLTSLVRDDKGMQVNKVTDLKDLRKIGEQPLEVREAAQNFLTLPLEGPGVLLVVASGKERDSDKVITRELYVTRSSFGAVLKETKDTFVIWSQDFGTLKSLGGGSAKLYGTLGKVTEIASDTAGADGIYTLPRNTNADWAVVTNGSSQAIVPMNGRFMYSQWGYTPFGPRIEQTRAFVFTDRPIYKPVDEVHFKAVMRRDDDAALTVPTGVAKVRLLQGYSYDSPKIVEERDVQISADGAVFGTFKLNNVQPGYYTLEVKQGDRQLASSSVLVDRYRKPEFSIDATSDRTEFVAGDKARVRVSGSYFSGQPLSGGSVTYSVRANSYYDYGWYSWRNRYDGGDYRYFDWGGTEVASGETTLDANGEAYVEIDTGKDREFARDRVFTVQVQYDNGSGNPSLATRNLLVYRGDYGMVVDDRLEVKTSVSVGETIVLPLMAEAHGGRAVPAGAKLTVKTHRAQWVRDVVRERRGKYDYWNYKLYEEDLPERVLTLDKDGRTTLSLDVQRAGSYRFTVVGKDASGREMHFEYSAWVSARNTPVYMGSEEQPMQFTVAPGPHAPGDTVEILLSSVIPERDVFVSVEREAMRQYFVLHLKGGQATMNLPLAQNDMPNLFLRASAFSETSYEVAYGEIKVSTDNRRLSVAVTADRAKYGPGDTVTLDVSTKDDAGRPASADVAVWAVDKAIFELATEAPLDIFNSFWYERWDSTGESNSLIRVGSDGAEKGGCFVGDTSVLMAGGGSKAIADVKVGDKVLTHPADAPGELVEAEVTEVRKHSVDGVLILNGDLRVTPEHRLRVADHWQTAGTLQLGDLLTDEDGGSVPVVSIEWQLGTVDVYNLTIAREHTFIAGGVWVHNEKGGGGSTRSTFKDTAYWNPSVKTDASGHATLRFKLPDNLTTWVTSAVGATADTKVGKDRSEIVVTKDVIMRPILPNLLRVGDDMVLSALMQNFTDKPRSFVTSLAFDAGSAELTRTGNRTVAAGKTEAEYWRVQPKVPTPAATLLYGFRAMDGGGVDNVQHQLPVKALTFKDKTSFVATHEDGRTEPFTIPLPSDADRSASTLSLALAPSVVGMLPHSLAYLIDYPYGCVEQTTSRLIPTIIAARSPELFADALKGKDIPAMVAKGVERLTELRNPDGGWGWWYGNSDPFVSSYVVEHLLLAQEAGFDVGFDLLERARFYFEGREGVQDGVNDASNARRDAAVARALQLLGSKQAKPIELDFAKIDVDLLSTAVLTNLALGVIDPAKSGLAELQKRAISGDDYYYWQAGANERFGSRSASTALALRALIAGKGDQRLIDGAVQFLGLNRDRGYWENTYGTVQTVRALSEYAALANETKTDLSYEVTLDGELVTSGKVTDFRQLLPAINVPIDAAKDGSKLAVTVTGTGRMYSTATLDVTRTDAARARKVTKVKLSRTYANQSRPGQPFGVGDEVRVILGVHGLPVDGANYVLIEDELPAGLVPVNKRLLNEGGSGGGGYEYYDYGYARDGIWWGGSSNELTENGMLIPIPHVQRKFVLTSYTARVVAEGKFLAPPARAELMYAPWLNARTGFQPFVTGQFLND